MEDEQETPTHLEVMNQIRIDIEQVLKDPLLNDLASDVSLEEVKSRLSVEQGRAITIRVKRFDGEVICATVNDLIKALEREVVRQLKRSRKTTVLSWKYVWRTYWLCYNHQKLSNRSAKLTSYGITNNDEVTFLKKLNREDRPKTNNSKLSQKRPQRPRNTAN